jgi:hypothetical protein
MMGQGEAASGNMCSAVAMKDSFFGPQHLDSREVILWLRAPGAMGLAPRSGGV